MTAPGSRGLSTCPARAQGESGRLARCPVEIRKARVGVSEVSSAPSATPRLDAVANIPEEAPGSKGQGSAMQQFRLPALQPLEDPGGLAQMPEVLVGVPLDHELPPAPPLLHLREPAYLLEARLEPLQHRRLRGSKRRCRNCAPLAIRWLRWLWRRS